MSTSYKIQASDTVAGSVASGSRSKFTGIFRGEILSVDTQTWQCEVAVNNRPREPMMNVEVAALYCHPEGGEGVYFLPEPGSFCYVCMPSDGSQPFIMSFVMPLSGFPGFSGGRYEISPGDIVLSTRDDNFVILRRGGLVQIGSTSLAQRLYIPVTNLIRDFFAKYEARSPNGEVTWTYRPISAAKKNKKSHEQKSRVTYTFRSREFVEEKHFSFLFEWGEPEIADMMKLPKGQKNKPSLLRMKITPDGSESMSIQISREGDVSLNMNHLRSTIRGDIEISHIGDKISLRSGSYEMSIKDGDQKISLDSLELDAESSVDINCDVINLGYGSYTAARADIIQELFTADAVAKAAIMGPIAGPPWLVKQKAIIATIASDNVFLD